MNSTGMSRSGSNPESRIRSRARLPRPGTGGQAISSILTGAPISRMKISPPRPMAPTCRMNWQASGMVMN
jgi:hypothetical protein